MQLLFYYALGRLAPKGDIFVAGFAQILQEQYMQ